MIRPRVNGPIAAVICSLALIVGLPALAAMIYYGLFASDLYAAEARFAIRGSQSAPQTGDIAWMLNGSSVGVSSIQDAMVVSDYIYSIEMLD